MSRPARADDPEDRAFLRAVLQNPAELTTWLAYADWLDERDDLRGRYIRLEVRCIDPELTQTDRDGVVAELEEVRAQLDPDWVAIFERPPIENCSDLFAYKCPKQWVQLNGTDDPLVRHCNACEREVYFCHSVSEVYDHARQGHCIAVAAGVPRSSYDLERMRDVDETQEWLLGTVWPPADATTDEFPILPETVELTREFPVASSTSARDGERTAEYPSIAVPPPPRRRQPWWKFW